MYKRVNVKLKGVCPLLFHNCRMVNPLDEFKKEQSKYTSKRKKTDEDHAEISRLDWYAAIYTDADGRVIVPAEMLEAAIVDGAKKSKLGKQFKAAVLIPDAARLIYDGPKKIDKLWADGRFTDMRIVRIKTSKIVRTRPIFQAWEVGFDLLFEPSIVDLDSVKKAIEDAGMQCGIGDYRPRYGRFELIEFALYE